MLVEYKYNLIYFSINNNNKFIGIGSMNELKINIKHIKHINCVLFLDNLPKFNLYYRSNRKLSSLVFVLIKAITIYLL